MPSHGVLHAHEDLEFPQPPTRILRNLDALRVLGSDPLIFSRVTEDRHILGVKENLRDLRFPPTKNGYTLIGEGLGDGDGFQVESPGLGSSIHSWGSTSSIVSLVPFVKASVARSTNQTRT